MLETISAQKRYGKSWDNQFSNHPHYAMSLTQEAPYSDAGNPLPVIGSFQTKTPLPSSPSQVFNVTFNVTTLNQLNLVGQSGIATLDLDVQRLMKELRTTTVQRSGPLKVIMSLKYGYNMLATSNVRYSLICSSPS